MQHFIKSYPFFFYREDRRRGYIGNDYGEQDDEIDYSKKYDDEDTILLVRSYWRKALQ